MNNTICYLKTGSNNWGEMNSVLKFTDEGKRVNIRKINTSIKQIHKYYNNRFIVVAQTGNPHFTAYDGVVDGEGSIIWINPKYITRIFYDCKFGMNCCATLNVKGFDSVLIKNRVVKLPHGTNKELIRFINRISVPIDFIYRYKLHGVCDVSMLRFINKFERLYAPIINVIKTIPMQNSFRVFNDKVKL